MLRPTRAQSRAKAAFHAKVQSNPLISGNLSTISDRKIAQMAGVADISKWMAQDGFREWFLNGDFNKELLESAVQTAIMEAISILEMPSDGEKGSPKPSDKIAAMKTILEYAGYAPQKKSEVVYQDKEIGDMSEEQLDKYLDKALKNRRKITSELQEFVEVTSGD